MPRPEALRGPAMTIADTVSHAVLLEDLGMRFSGAATAALEHIQAAIPLGKICGVVGPDAAGKTTLMRILAGLMLPTHGKVHILGQSPEACAAAGHTGYMPQRFGLYEDLSVRDNLLLHARLRGLDGPARQQLFARLLDFTSLAPFTTRLAGRLSGGMKQKLGIACALLGHPRVLLLDEPGVGVDPQSRRELWRMVQDLCGEGMTIIWATAYLEEAERCPHVIMLEAGKVLYQGPPAALTARAAGRVFALRPSAGENSKSLLARWSCREGVGDALIQGGHVRVVLQEAAQELKSALRKEEASPLPPRLEDAYMTMLGGISKTLSPYEGASAISTAGELAPVRIEAQGLTRHFGDFVAAQNISFSVRAGEIFGLLGPNGAGKSTTFRMLCGLLRPSAGQCRVDGVDMLTAGSEARSRLGYMAQKFSLYQDIPVRENIHIMADLYGLDRAQRARIPQLAEALELADYLPCTTAALPLGHKQRLALLCATLHQPPVLFLDEPTSGVDARTRREFWKHITALTRAGAAVLVTTHFMEEAEYCDAIALVYQGSIIARGTPDQLKQQTSAARHAEPAETTGEHCAEDAEGADDTRGTANTSGADGTGTDGTGMTLEEAFIACIEDWDARTKTGKPS